MPNAAAENLFRDILAKCDAKPLTQADVESQGLVPFTFRGGPADGESMYVSPDRSGGQAGCFSPCGADSDVLAVHTYVPDPQTRSFHYTGVEGFIDLREPFSELTFDEARQAHHRFNVAWLSGELDDVDDETARRLGILNADGTRWPLPAVRLFPDLVDDLPGVCRCLVCTPSG